MTEEHIVTLIVAVIASGSLSTIIGWVLHRIDARHKPDPEIDELRYGVQTLLFQKLQTIHSRTVHDGWCPDDLKRTTERIYKAYHGLGGNGVGTAMYKEIITASSTPKEDDESKTVH